MALFARAEEQLSRVDAAISSTGIGGPAALAHEITRAQWEAVIATNLTGSFLFTAAAARAMVPRGGGSITLVTSQVSEVAQRNCAAYVASKGVAKMLVKAMALAHISMGRMGRPEEVADAAVFLASDSSAYVTGTTVFVDGGYLTV